MPYNPFNLRGPEFLVFFIVFAVILTILLNHMRKRNEANESITLRLAQDPYQIAYLRGGRSHLIQTAVFALLDRELLKSRDSKLRTPDPKSVDLVKRPLEKSILRRFLREDRASALLSDSEINERAEDIGDILRTSRLVPDEDQKAYRMKLFLQGMILLWGVSITKIMIAFSRGHSNVEFLVILSIVFSVAVRKVLNKPRTLSGDNEFSNLKEMFRRMYEGRLSLRPHAANDKLVLLAALFGFSALPALAEAMIAPLQVKPVRESGSGCGSSCASSGCSSGGGSCGGGCGGGGGGGCGGCGS